MFYDESTYPTPHKFDPGRFLKDGKLDPSIKDPEDTAFGSGRRCKFDHHRPQFNSHRTEILHFLFFDRICPGRHLALRTLFFNIACILTLFNIEAPLDEKLEAEFTEESMRCVTTSWPLRHCGLAVFRAIMSVVADSAV